MTRNEPEDYGSEDILYDSEDFAYDDTATYVKFLSRNPRCNLRNPGERIQWGSFIDMEYIECVKIRGPPVFSFIFITKNDQ